MSSNPLRLWALSEEYRQSALQGGPGIFCFPKLRIEEGLRTPENLQEAPRIRAQVSDVQDGDYLLDRALKEFSDRIYRPTFE